MLKAGVFYFAIGLVIVLGAGCALAQEKSFPLVSGAAPPTIKDFVGDPVLSRPRLSPSGRKMVIVRRVGDIDQIIRVDVADFKETLIYRTRKVPEFLEKKNWRYYISYMEWKTEDSLLVSVSGPIRAFVDNEDQYYDLPVHFILRSDGDKAPLFLNETVAAGHKKIELSYIQSALPHDPDHIELLTRPDLQFADVVKVDIRDGQRVLLEHGDTYVSDYGSDIEGNIVTRTLDYGAGMLTMQGRAPGEKRWTKITDIRAKEEKELAKYNILGLGPLGVLYVAAKPTTPTDGDTKAVRKFDLKTLSLGPVVWSNPNYDVDDIVQDEETGEILAGCYWIDTYHCDFKNIKLTSNLRGLNRFFEDKRNLFIVSKSKDDKFWMLSVEGPDDPGSYYIYDVDKHDVRNIGQRWPELTPERLSPMRRLDFKAHDGLSLSAYVTEPRAPARRAQPLIVLPHGGPEARDGYAFDTWSQFFASRGYVVIQPNFRGSSGLGRKFAEAGYGEWGGLMHQDVMDAVKALISEGKVDPARICIVGASYGGYEALYSAAVEAATFKCAVSIDGVSDLVGEMKFERSFGRDSVRYNYWLKSQGDPAKDGPRMMAHSPFRLAPDWKTPLLLIHGDKDTIVPVEESRQMKRALDGKDVRYVEIANMGHGPSTSEEFTKVLTEMEKFVGQYIGETSTSGGAPPGAH